MIDLSPHGDYAVLQNGALEFAKAVNYSYGASITGAGSFTKSGPGVLTLTGSDTHTGGTTVNAGRLVVPSLQGGYVTNAALEYSGSGQATFSGAITGTGSFTRSSLSGTLTLNGANAYTGGTFLTGGGRIIDQNPHGAYDVAAGATVEFQNAGDLTSALPITGAGIFAKSGTGTLTLTGGDASTGGTIVRTGRLVDLNPHGANYNTGSVLEFRNAGRPDLRQPDQRRGRLREERRRDADPHGDQRLRRRHHRERRKADRPQPPRSLRHERRAGARQRGRPDARQPRHRQRLPDQERRGNAHANRREHLCGRYHGERRAG